MTTDQPDRSALRRWLVQSPRACWLMKSEPEVFSFEDLALCPGQTEPWNGVRNYQARNYMRDAMQPGDAVLFYHSNCAQPGIVGIATLASAARPDPTQFEVTSPYHDPTADPANPRWLLVDVRYDCALPAPVTLASIKDDPVLGDMLVARRGQRLSIQPVALHHFAHIVQSVL
jgi:predicted RNA-binding protein with PUA-like domain